MLHVDKVDSHLTEKIEISASGLKKFECYKFYLKLHYEFGKFHSFCICKSDEFGRIDLKKDKPIRGTYHEIDQMGLFLSIQPSQEVRFGFYVKNTTAKPFYYTLQLISASDEVIDEINLMKRWIHPLAEQINISEIGFHGTIFKPPGPGPFPCIIDVPGALGNLTHGYSSVFSASGFLVYTFAYYEYKDLPKKIQDVDVECFSRHIKFVLSLPYCNGKIGLYGSSLGGTIANYLASKHPELSGIVSLNGPEAFYKNTAVMRENGKPMEVETYDGKNSLILNSVVRQKETFMEMFSRLKPETSIKWNNISKSIPFRIVSSMDDWIICGITNAMNIRNHLIETGHHVEMEFIPAGHLIFVPYYPFQSFSYNKFVRLSLGFGGECTIHTKSQETIWQGHIDFFKKFLGNPPKLPEYKRQTVVFIPNSKESKL